MKRGPGDWPDNADAIRGIRGKKVFIRTFGCTYNVAESQKLGHVLGEQQCTLVKDPGEAELAVVNTCTVIGATERKVIRALLELRHLPLYVTGCMAAVQRDLILSVCNPIFISPSDIQVAYRREGTVPGVPVGIVQICRGCRGSCSYCITRRARGALVSRSPAEIEREVKLLAERGAAEIPLTGQDVSSWGADAGSDLGMLLARINTIPGTFMVRVGMMNPATLYPIRESVAGAYLGERIFSMLHLPIQSGSDAILERMGRGYGTDQVIRIVRGFRELHPDISLHTDIICGFPGETEEDFEETLAVLHLVQPDKVNITRYSQRPGTPAEREKDMPDRFKKERSRVLRIHSERIARQRNAAWVSREVPVIFTEHPRAGSSMGRTPNYQGVVVPEHCKPGTVGTVRLTEDRVYYFLGELV